MSIANVIGALRADLGVHPTTINFVRPTPPDVFDDVWKDAPGVTSMSMDTAIRIEPADEISREALRDLLEAPRSEPNSPA